MSEAQSPLNPAANPPSFEERDRAALKIFNSQAALAKADFSAAAMLMTQGQQIMESARQQLSSFYNGEAAAFTREIIADSGTYLDAESAAQLQETVWHVITPAGFRSELRFSDVEESPSCASPNDPQWRK